MSWLNFSRDNRVDNSDNSVNTNNPVTNNNNDHNTPVISPVINITLDQNDSSTGKTNTQRADQKADISASTSTDNTSSRSRRDISDDPKPKSSKPSEIMPALGAAAAGYLIGYALDLDAKNSMVAAAINGVSFIAGGMIAEQIQDKEAEKNQLIGIGAGVAISMGGLFLLGGGDVTTSLGISMAGGIGGASVSYLTNHS